MEIYTPEEAPSFARASSSFRSDSRCEDVFYIVGDDEYEVMENTNFIFSSGDFTDYDVNYSLEGDTFVGVLCRDLPLEGQLAFEDDPDYEVEVFDKNGLVNEE